MSRRQIEWDGGYVMSTKDFIEYVRNSKANIVIERDHGGISQGINFDNGTLSFYIDAANGIDIIHIDPWKWYSNYEHGLIETIDNIKYISRINPNVNFEIGTEESIRYFSSAELYKFINDLKDSLTEDLFLKIKYAVVQSGNKLLGTQNIAKFDFNRLDKMMKVCQEFGILSKEHNGDYLSKKEINLRFESGLDAINIAPELGTYETNILLDHLKNNKDFDRMFEISYDGTNLKKWVNKDFDPLINKRELIEIAGHYHNKELKSIVKINDKIIKSSIKELLNQFLND